MVEFGLQPPSADWGPMLNENRIGLAIQPYSVFVPVAVIAILTTGVNLATYGLALVIIGIERNTGRDSRVRKRNRGNGFSAVRSVGHWR